MRVDLLISSFPPETIALRPASPRDGAACSSSRRRRAFRRPPRDRSSRRCCGPATRWSSTTRESFARASMGFVPRGETRAHIEATLIERLSPSHWRA